jgi:hypothetical protein
MLLNGGELNGAEIRSRKPVELASHNQVEGKPDGGNYQLGFGVNSLAEQLDELDSAGSDSWGGFNCGSRGWVRRGRGCGPGDPMR